MNERGNKVGRARARAHLEKAFLRKFEYFRQFRIAWGNFSTIGEKRKGIPPSDEGENARIGHAIFQFPNSIRISPTRSMPTTLWASQRSRVAV